MVILQHPDEVKKPLGTAKIVSLCLQESVIKVGINFENDLYLNQLIKQDINGVGVLYPSDSAIELSHWLCSKALDGADQPCSQPLSKNSNTNASKILIVLDGTWRNVREIFNTNLFLQSLPAFKLTPTSTSNYRIRKAPFESSLSTVEAVAQSLNILEPETSVEGMIDCFNNMIDYQISRMGNGVYQKNYIQ